MSAPVYGTVGVMMAAKAGVLPPSLSTTDLLVLFILADYAGEDGEAFPSWETVGSIARCSRATVHRSIGVLVEAGLLTKPVRRKYLPTKYSVALPPMEDRQRDDRPSDDPRAIEKSIRETSHRETSHREDSQTATRGVSQGGPRSLTGRPDPTQGSNFKDPTGDLAPVGAPSVPPFVLTSPEAPPSPPATKPPKAPKVRKQKTAKEPEARSSEHGALVAHYFEAFGFVRGVKPTFTAREGKSIASLLAALGLDEAKRRIDAALADPFWATKVTINTIANEPDKFTAANSWRPGGPAPDADEQHSEQELAYLRSVRDRIVEGPAPASAAPAPDASTPEDMRKAARRAFEMFGPARVPEPLVPHLSDEDRAAYSKAWTAEWTRKNARGQFLQPPSAPGLPTWNQKTDEDWERERVEHPERFLEL